MTERLLLSLLIVVAIVAAIPQAAFFDWGIVLVVLGMIAAGLSFARM